MARLLTIEVYVLAYLINVLTQMAQDKHEEFIQAAKEMNIAPSDWVATWIAERVKEYADSGLDAQTYVEQLSYEWGE